MPHHIMNKSLICSDTEHRRGDLVASWLGRSSPESVTVSNPGRRHCFVFLGHFTLTVPLFTQQYKWVMEKAMLVITLQ